MQSPTTSPDLPPLHDAGGNGQTVEYRTLSVLAVVSLILGLASPLGLLAPLLLAIAFFGAAAAILAIRRIATSDGLLAGRGVALAGLALCVASIGAFYGRSLATRQLFSHQAHQVALQWFELLQSDQAEQALELTTERLQTTPPPESEEEAGDEHAASHALEHFREHPLVRALAAVGPGADVRWDQDLAIDVRQHGLGTVRQLYTFTPRDSGQPAFDATITLQRAKKTGQDRPSWLVADYEL